MTRASGVSVENNFSRGLITEGTAMNFPENAVRETDNCIFTKEGKVIRRYGVNYEQGYTVTNFSTMSIMASAGTPSDYYDDVVLTEFNWISVSNDGATSFLVQQIGDRLVFFNITSDNNISSGRKSFSIDLDTYLVTVPGDNVGQYTAAQECSFSSGFGYLFVTHPLCNPFYVSYDATADSITAAAITINIRDFERLNDSLAIDERPSSLTDLHKYNLYNQGWYLSAISTAGLGNVLTRWDTVRSDFPSNADYWWLYKNTSNEFDTGQIDKFAFGNSPAPNGHYIVNPFNNTRNTTISGTGLPEPTSNGARPAVNAFYTGRVWYAGVDAQEYSTRIYFSKIIEGVTDFGKCYQINDPTSEDNADLLPTDGGVIVIPDIAQVIRLVAVRESLLVFCTNGIWKISGGSGGGFAANDYSISKVSSVSAKAKNSIVLVEGSPMWWDTAGIYTIQFDPTSGLEQVINISEPSIQTLVSSIPNENFPYIKGTYNNLQKTVHFLYRSSFASTLTALYQYDKLLVYSVVGNSFAPQSFSSGTPTVSGVMFPNYANNDVLISEEQASIVKFITIGAIGTSGAVAYTISQFNDNQYMDWRAFDGVGIDYDSYFVTGYRVRGDLLKKTQNNYLVVMLEQEENASCLVQGVWDYSNNDTGFGRFTSSQQVYRSDASKDYSRRKLRIRGSGYSLQFKFYSQTGRPFTLVGWTAFETGNNVP